MDDRSKYVDIFFRNGLKEFEVLPPQGVWDNIKPRLSKRARSRNIFSVAAAIAIIASLTTASVWFSQRISKDFSHPAISMNQETFPDGSYIPFIQPERSPSVEVPVLNIKEPLPENSDNIVVASQVNPESFNSEVYTANINDGRLLLKNNPLIQTQNVINSPFSSQINNSAVKDDKKEIVNKSGRWTLSAIASPDYYSNISNESNQVASQLSKSEKPVVSYSGGMGFAYKVNRRMSVQSGVIYASIGQNVTGISSYSGFSEFNDVKGSSAFSVQTSSGLIVSVNNNIFLRDDVSERVITKYTSDSFDPAKADLTYLNSSVTQNFNYLEIPVLLRYKAIDRKIDVNLIGGLSYNMLVGNSVFAKVNGEKVSIGKTDGLNPVNFSSSLGLGLEYSLSGKISLNIEPTFRYYLTPFGTLAGSSVHPYSFGVLSGLSYKF